MNTMSPLRIGFLGGSLDSAVGMTHVLACQLDRRWRLSAACFSQVPEMNERTAEHWGIDPNRVYGQWLEMLEAETGNLDAVAVLTPTPLHAEMVDAALELGYPVICEKSLCTTVDEARQLQQKTRKLGGLLAVIYNYTGYPMLREMRCRIRNGDIGHLTQIHVEMPQEGFLKLDREGHEIVPQSWRLADGEIPTLHLDLGVHVENLVYFLSGFRADKVLAVNNTYGHFKDVVDNTLCIARYPNNIDVQAWFGKSALGHSNGLRVRVFGSRGAMEWLQLDPDRMVIHDNSGSSQVIDPRTTGLMVAAEPRYNRFKPGHPNGFIEAFANYYEDLADMVLAHGDDRKPQNPWAFDVDDAVAGMMTLDAMQKSAITENWTVNSGV